MVYIVARWLLLFGLFVELVGYIWLLVMIGGAEPGKKPPKPRTILLKNYILGTPWIHVKLLLGAGIVLFGLPFVFSPNGSLLSKLLPKHVQGTIMCCYWLHMYFKTSYLNNCRIWSRSTTVCRLNCSHPGASVGWCFTTPLLCSSRSTSWHSDWTYSKLPVGLYNNALT